MNVQSQPITHAENRARFDRFIADLAVRFIDVPTHEIDREIESSLKLISETWGFDRGALAESDVAAKSFVVTHSWVLSGALSSRGFTQDDVPWLTAKILRGEVIRVARRSDLPEEAAKDMETFRFLA